MANKRQKKKNFKKAIIEAVRIARTIDLEKLTEELEKKKKLMESIKKPISEEEAMERCNRFMKESGYGELVTDIIERQLPVKLLIEVVSKAWLVKEAEESGIITVRSEEARMDLEIYKECIELRKAVMRYGKKE